MDSFQRWNGGFGWNGAGYDMDALHQLFSGTIEFHRFVSLLVWGDDLDIEDIHVKNVFFFIRAVDMLITRKTPLFYRIFSQNNLLITNFFDRG